jgi:FUS-interacting serine-arginine-rich protein 1
LPRDYYSGDPRGFGFVQFLDPADAAEAKYQMDGQMLQGRQLTVVFAEENRKKPTDMRARERRARFSDRRRTPPSRYSRSPPPRYARSRSRDYSPPKRHQYSNSRSVSPVDKKRSMPRTSRERSYSKSPAPYKRREKSPPYAGSGASRSPPHKDNRNRPHSPPVRFESPAQYSRGPDSEASPSH